MCDVDVPQQLFCIFKTFAEYMERHHFNNGTWALSEPPDTQLATAAARAGVRCFIKVRS
jgi:hypothetical protein